MMTEEEASALLTKVYERYNERVLALMNVWADKIKASGHPLKDLRSHRYVISSAPADFSGDDYMWDMSINLDSTYAGLGFKGQGVGITVKLTDSLSWAGERVGDTKDGPFGCNWMVDVIEWGGLIVGTFSPYNYTPQVWVSLEDEAAIEERFKMISELNIDGPDGVIEQLDRVKRVVKEMDE